MMAGTDEHVVVVDENDREIGQSEKLAAHRAPGLLHRAFSVLVFDAAGRLLLQRRAPGKYHFAGRWSNSCCGHPRPGELIAAAAARRVREELRLDVCVYAGPRFEYRAQDTCSDLVEHEIDHVFRAIITDQRPDPDPDEIDACCWIERGPLERWIAREPARFTPWLAPVLHHGKGLWP